MSLLEEFLVLILYFQPLHLLVVVVALRLTRRDQRVLTAALAVEAELHRMRPVVLETRLQPSLRKEIMEAAELITIVLLAEAEAAALLLLV
jgi:hypothetical protein